MRRIIVLGLVVSVTFGQQAKPTPQTAVPSGHRMTAAELVGNTSKPPAPPARSPYTGR